MNASLKSLTLAATISALLLSPDSRAAEFCATTGDQLAQALADADSNNQDDLIEVTVGVKTRTNAGSGVPRWQYVAAASDADNSLTIAGGFSTGCGVQIVNSQTTLDAELDGPALEIVLGDSTLSEVNISNFKIVRGYAAGFSGASGMRIDASSGGSPSILAERMFFSNSGASADQTSVVRLQLSGGNLRFRNSQISTNTTRNGAALMASVGIGAELTLANNTVINNHDSAPTSATPVGGVAAWGNGTMNIYNNLFWSNTSISASDLEVPNGFASLSNNHIGLLRGTPDTNYQTTTGNPLITIVNGGFARPALNSPVRDSGSTYVPGGRGDYDVLGQLRVQGDRVDRGAIEVDVLFGNSFE